MKSLTRLYVGHKDRDGFVFGSDSVQTDRFDHALDQACHTLSREFGGCSTFPATGYFVLASGKLIREDTTVLEVAHDDSPDASATIAGIARYLADKLNQECVLVASTPLTTFDFVKP